MASILLVNFLSEGNRPQNPSRGCPI